MTNCYKYCLLLMGLLMVTIAPAIALPQKQSLSLNTSNKRIEPGTQERNSIVAREYTFKAPDNKIFTDTEQLKAARGYKVEVYDADRELLLRVKDIEPRAFAKGDIIQVGIFQRQKNAEDLVRKLANAGLWARIVPQ